MSSLPLNNFSGKASAILILVLIIGLPVYGQWSTDPTENTEICTAKNDQTSHVIVSDGFGGAIVAWEDTRLGGIGNFTDIYAQRISAAGEMQWTFNGKEISTASKSQSMPAIVSDGAGGAIIAWLDGRNNISQIYAQRINASGVIQWTVDGIPVVETGAQNYAMISDGTGGAIITWIGSNWDIYAQRINGAGEKQWASDGVVISGAAGYQQNPKLVGDGSGGTIITWEDNRDSLNYAVYDIYTQRINNNGVVQWTTDGVGVCTEATDQHSPDIISDSAGGAIIVWVDRRSGNDDVYVQRVNGIGEMQWTTNGVSICKATGDQKGPILAIDGSNGAIVSWSDGRGNDVDVYAQRIAANGTVQWATDGVPLTTEVLDQVATTCGPDGSDGAIVAWHWYKTYDTRSDIYAQRINSNGTVQWTAGGVAISTSSGHQTLPALVTDNGGGAIIAWIDSRLTSSYDIFAQQVNHLGELGVASPISAEEPTDLPRVFSLKQNYPNPFNPTTVIPYELPAKSHVTLRIYNVLGQEVATLVNSDMKAGRYQARWDARNMPSGVYIYMLQAGSFIESRKLVLIK